MSEYLNLNSLLFYQELAEKADDRKMERVIYDGYIWNLVSVENGIAKLESPYNALSFSQELITREVPIDKIIKE